MTTRARMSLGLGCAALLAAGACGNGSDYDTETNPQAALQAVSQLAGIGGSVQAGSPDSTSSGVLSLGTVAQNIIVPVIDQGNQTSARITDPGGLSSLTGSCTCDPSGCVFDGCGDDTGSFTIDGSISVSGDTYSFDVAITQSSSSDTTSTSTHMSTSGEITIGATAIDGSVSGRGDTTLVLTDPDRTQTIKGSWDWDMDANQISLDQSRCAVGGALHACFAAKASTQGRSADYNGCGTVDFGPTCGEAVAE